MSRIKSLISDTFVYGIFTIVSRFLTFMLTPIYTNYLNMVEFADIQYVFVLLAVINIIYGFGMDSAFFRFYEQGNPKESDKVFTQSYLMIFIISFCISFSFIIFSGKIAPFISKLDYSRELVILAAIIPFLDALMIIPYSYLRMTRQARKFALTKFILVVIAVTLNVIFVVTLRWGPKGILYAQIIANFIGASIFIKLIKEKVSLKFDFPLLKEMLKFGIPTLPAMLSGMILQVADRWILKPLSNDIDFAIYQCNYKLGIPMILLVSTFEYAWKPFYLTHYKDADAKKLFAKILTYFTIIASILFLVTVFYMDYLVRFPFIGGRFINPDYWSGMGIIPIILISYYFNGVYNNIASGFHIEKKTNYLPLAIVFAAFVNIILNFILIPKISYWGAAWATIISYFLSALFLYLFSLKVYHIHYEWGRLIKIISLTGIYYWIASTFIPENYDLVTFLSKTFIVIFYLVTLYLFKLFTPDEITRIKRFLRISN